MYEDDHTRSGKVGQLHTMGVAHVTEQLCVGARGSRCQVVSAWQQRQA